MSGADSVVHCQDYFSILSDCYHAVDFLMAIHNFIKEAVIREVGGFGSCISMQNLNLLIST